ncbi:hypothetical protein BFP97_06100 [Roseivirga sp. 4D4]|uniref:hypothetical protein n=1 Tax=Roseivirga sp. 4D4 TaxID=1889784 RepID=UPI000853D7AD|nr:hypothetical protein [Roseivirga sp. 4D4]OEK01105.1 hypothetical protein BFP97_06100 [Roseivirga sp. 4D4]
MKSSLNFFWLIMALACSSSNDLLPANKESRIAEKYFQSLDSQLTIDQNHFWGQTLKGPVILVNPTTRLFYSNENDALKTFSKIGRIYADTLPDDIPIANTALTWNKKRWTMAMLPLSENVKNRNRLLIHESFHRIQPSLGFNSTNPENAHLDLFEGRVNMRLEIAALKLALLSSDDTELKKHLQAAIHYRRARHLYPKAQINENRHELNEGLAEYTALMLNGFNRKEAIEFLINQAEKFTKSNSFQKSFAYLTLPMYGFLLNDRDNDWHKKLTDESMLTDLIIESFNLKTLSALLIPNSEEYDYATIVSEEKLFSHENRQRVDRYQDLFIKSPTVRLPTSGSTGSFDPNRIYQFNPYGKVYGKASVIAHWGLLEINKEALFTSNDTVMITTPYEELNSIISGDGWTLKLNNGWYLIRDKKNFKPYQK